MTTRSEVGIYGRLHTISWPSTISRVILTCVSLLQTAIYEQLFNEVCYRTGNVADSVWEIQNGTVSIVAG